MARSIRAPSFFTMAFHANLMGIGGTSANGPSPYHLSYQVSSGTGISGNVDCL